MINLEGSNIVVVEGRWWSSEHLFIIFLLVLRVWVDIARQLLKILWKVTPYVTTIKEFVGTTIAWPVDRVIMFAASQLF